MIEGPHGSEGGLATAVLCPNCRAPYTGEKLSASARLARCDYCGSRFAVDDRMREIESVRGDFEKMHRPKSIRIEDDLDEWRLTRRWFHPMAFFLLFFCIAWDSFLIFWYSAVSGGGPASWIAILFPIAHVAVGLGLSYFTLALFLNRTRITLRRDELSVSIGPLPWRGSCSFDSRDIEQLYCMQIDGKKSDSKPSYQVRVRFSKGPDRILVRGMLELEVAQYIERAIENKLDLAPYAVEGEAS